MYINLQWDILQYEYFYFGTLCIFWYTNNFFTGLFVITL